VKVVTDDHLSSSFIYQHDPEKKMLKALVLRGRKMADIGAICKVALLLDAGISPRAPEFSQLLVDLGFVADKVSLTQVFLLVLLFPSVPRVPHILPFIYHRRNIIFTTESVVTLQNLTHRSLFWIQKYLNECCLIYYLRYSVLFLGSDIILH
jgi:hypothetical protein